MPFKLNISNKEKAWKLELENEALVGKSVGDKFDGKIIKPELEGYELEITGGSDLAGFPMSKNVEGIGLKKVLLTKGWGMWSKPRGEKKKVQKANKGLRLRKTVRGKTISDKVIQINLIVIKEGSKKLEEVFPDQNKAPAPKADEKSPEKQVEEKAPETEAPKDEPKVEEEKPIEAAPAQ